MTCDGQGEVRCPASRTLVLYDGVCGLCNRFVNFLLRRDRRDQFRFAPLQGGFAREILRRHGRDTGELDTVIVLPDVGQADERVLVRSEAMLWAVSRLGGIWRPIAIAGVLPRSLRDWVYADLARRRYGIFGKYPSCPIPAAKDRHKFL